MRSVPSFLKSLISNMHGHRCYACRQQEHSFSTDLKVTYSIPYRGSYTCAISFGATCRSIPFRMQIAQNILYIYGGALQVQTKRSHQCGARRFTCIHAYMVGITPVVIALPIEI